MARCTYVYRNGEFVEKCGPLDIRMERARSDLPCPMLNLDTQADLLNHADGKIYSSKSEMRKVYKAHGMVEMGNDAPTKPPEVKGNKISKADVAAALDKVKQGYKPRALSDDKAVNISGN